MHIPGVGQAIENAIWENDIHSWQDFLDNHHKLSLGSNRKEHIHHHIKKSIQAFQEKNFDFFDLPSNLHWRPYQELKEQCCFIDIETTGLDKQNDDITLIGLYDGQESQFFVKDKNLLEFSQEIKKYSMLVTFNGRCFDIPFIRSKFPQIKFNHFHADLRWLMKELGYTGGLKRIEKEIGITRDSDLDDVDGFEAVRLWYKYKRGDPEALSLLIKYNRADIENLKTMMDFAFKKLKRSKFK